MKDMVQMVIDINQEMKRFLKYTPNYRIFISKRKVKQYFLMMDVNLEINHKQEEKYEKINIVNYPYWVNFMLSCIRW